MSKQRPRRWMPLDNAALIFPAIARADWVNAFRVSVTLSEPVDPRLLAAAAEDLIPRFPSLYVRLGTGLFWYFLEETHKAPKILPEYAYPLTHMSRKQLSNSCLRILYFENRIAVEFFHSLTDGSGGLAYVKALAARYLMLAHSLSVFPGEGIKLAEEAPTSEELEDAFLKSSGRFAMSRKEPTCYRLSGSRDKSGFMHLLTGVISTSALLEKAHEYGTTVTGLLCAVMTRTIIDIQQSHVKVKHQKPVKITVPINLRKLFSQDTMRNFSLVLNIGVDPRLKDYSVRELCEEYNHQMALELRKEKMAARIAANVLPQRLLAMKLVTLPIKNVILRAVYASVGESRGCLNISNLGEVRVPAVLEPYIDRFEFIVGVQYTYPNNCSVSSFKGKTYINMIRNIRETELERRFFSLLVEMGIEVAIESNEPPCR